MTQAKVGTVQGFLEIPELLQPTQPGGLTRQTEARNRTGKGSWHFERSPVEAATRPLGWEGLQSHPAFLWCSWGKLRPRESQVRTLTFHRHRLETLIHHLHQSCPEILASSMATFPQHTQP